MFRWAMSEGYGACLINKPELVKDMVRLVRNQVDNPNYTASIKIRCSIEWKTVPIFTHLAELPKTFIPCYHVGHPWSSGDCLLEW